MICWLDLETTGLVPESGEILEIAAILTDDELVEIDRFASLVRPPRGFESKMDDFVTKMHEASGLLAALEVVENGQYLSSVCGEFERWLRMAARGHALRSGVDVDAMSESDIRGTLKKVPLGGNSIHFDRAWLRHHAPEIEALFLHRNVDCSTVNEMARRWTPDVHDARPGAGAKPAHRALADVRESIALARYYRGALFTKASK
jgi:oligoribonuclease